MASRSPGARTDRSCSNSMEAACPDERGWGGEPRIRQLSATSYAVTTTTYSPEPNDGSGRGAECPRPPAAARDDRGESWRPRPGRFPGRSARVTPGGTARIPCRTASPARQAVSGRGWAWYARSVCRPSNVPLPANPASGSPGGKAFRRSWPSCRLPTVSSGRTPGQTTVGATGPGGRGRVASRRNPRAWAGNLERGGRSPGSRSRKSHGPARRRRWSPPTPTRVETSRWMWGGAFAGVRGLPTPGPPLQLWLAESENGGYVAGARTGETSRYVGSCARDAARRREGIRRAAHHSRTVMT
jgi:hypothetical protein